MAGSLSVRKRAAAGVSPYDLPNAARTFAHGVTYGFSDELEAMVRAAAKGDPDRYRAIVNRIRAEQERYANANPKTAMALEGAGMLGGAMLTPQLAAARGAGALSRTAPRATKFVIGGLEDVAQGALYAAGQAPDWKSAPRVIAEETPYNAAAYGGISAAEAAGRKALGKAVSTQRGYNIAMALRNLLGKY